MNLWYDAKTFASSFETIIRSSDNISFNNILPIRI